MPMNALSLEMKIRELDSQENLDITNEIGLAELIVQLYANEILFVPVLGWLVWNGKQWEIDNDNVVVLKVIEMCQQLKKIIISKNEKKMLKFIPDISQNRKINSILKLAGVMPPIVSKQNTLDSTQTDYLFNCQNGTFNLNTMKLQPHNPTDYITKISNVTYNETAKPDKFIKFLNTTFCNNQDTISYIQRYFGYTLTACINEQSLALFCGTGANGKTQLLEIISLIMKDYYQKIESNTFLDDRGNNKSLALANAKGARMIYAGEFNGKKIDEAFVKTITGGEEVSARHHFKNFFQYYPTYKIFMTSNDKPRVSGNDHGFWRRFKSIEFKNVIPTSDQIKDFGRFLFNEEGSAIFNWVLSGYMAWISQGLGSCKEVDDATQDYKEESDILHDFFQDKIEVDKFYCVKSSALHKAINDYRKAAGLNAISTQRMAHYLINKGFDKKQKTQGAEKGSKYWHGLGLKDAIEHADQNDLLSDILNHDTEPF